MGFENMSLDHPEDQALDVRASIRANKLFAGLNDAAVADCTAQFTPLRARKSRVLFRQGDAGRQVCLVLDGFVRIGRLTEDGRDLTVRILHRGDFFGEEVLFADTTRSSSATALDDCEIAVCRADSLAALLMRHPQLSLNIARSSRADHDRTLDHIQAMAFDSVVDRLFALLCELAQECGVHAPGGTRIEAALTQAQLASLIGTTRETMSCELSKLARSGRISRSGGKIVLRSMLAQDVA
jgi:CRP-like cAMP-binding protein